MTVMWEKPDWQAPTRVFSAFTHRGSGDSPYGNFNLASHVGDDESQVSRNRESLIPELMLPSAPVWMNQVHSGRVVEVASLLRTAEGSLPKAADGAYTCERGVVLAMLVADCLPLILCSETGEEVAVLHAGWRGLADGIIANGIEKFTGEVGYAWVGPGIGPCHYEVDKQVRQRFIEFEDAFANGRDANHWMLDLKKIAVDQLKRHGVRDISVSDRCTYCERRRYFSARRDKVCGRMAALVWMS